MTIGRTHDSHVVIDTNPGGAGTGAEIINALGLTVEGETTTTQEYYLGERAAQASVHAIGGGVSFSTLYDTADFDTLSGIRETTPQQSPVIAIVCDENPKSWQIIPVQWIKPSWDAPSTDAVTRPWALTRSGLGAFGVNVTPFSVDAGAASNLVTGFGPNKGTRAAIIITEIASAVTAIALAGRADLPQYGNANQRRVSIRQFDVASGNAANLTMQTTGGTVAGFVVQGSREALP